MTDSNGLFISFEGIEGAGKSTHIEFVDQFFKNHGWTSVLTREPGGTKIGEELRQMLLSHKYAGMSNQCELLLMFAARAEHLHSVILPSIEAGHVVLCDRFTDATYAYQGGGRGIDKTEIALLEQFVQSGQRPDLTLLLDLPVTLGLERAAKRADKDRFEKEQTHFFERVRQTYRAIAKNEPSRVKVIDASRALKQVKEQITQVLDEFLGKRG